MRVFAGAPLQFSPRHSHPASSLCTRRFNVGIGMNDSLVKTFTTRALTLLTQATFSAAWQARVAAASAGGSGSSGASVVPFVVSAKDAPADRPSVANYSCDERMFVASAAAESARRYGLLVSAADVEAMTGQPLAVLDVIREQVVLRAGGFLNPGETVNPVPVESADQ